MTGFTWILCVGFVTRGGGQRIRDREIELERKREREVEREDGEGRLKWLITIPILSEPRLKRKTRTEITGKDQ